MTNNLNTVNLNPILIKMVEDKILETLQLAQNRFNRNFPIPNLSFKLKSKRVAGKAHYALNLIKINPLFLNQFTLNVLHRTVPHEVAHLITHAVYPQAKQHHGPEFRAVMRRLGNEDCSTYHTMRLDTSLIPRKTNVINKRLEWAERILNNNKNKI